MRKWIAALLFLVLAALGIAALIHCTPSCGKPPGSQQRALETKPRTHFRRLPDRVWFNIVAVNGFNYPTSDPADPDRIPILGLVETSLVASHGVVAIYPKGSVGGRPGILESEVKLFELTKTVVDGVGGAWTLATELSSERAATLRPMLPALD